MVDQLPFNHTETEKSCDWPVKVSHVTKEYWQVTEKCKCTDFWSSQAELKKLCQKGLILNILN